MERMTNSLMGYAKKCLRLYYLKYICRLQRVRTSAPLRLGGVYHKGQELHGNGDPNAIVKAATEYDNIPEWADPLAWAVERETVRNLLAGHFWRYEADNLEVVANERAFELPLVNPDTGRSSRTFVVCGKIDKIVRMPDGRLAVLEYKTCGQDIGPESDYWLRLRYDSQVSLYVLAARALGFDVATALYDVTRKPEISPRQIPELDEHDLKIVVDGNGQRVMKKDGTPRQTADSAQGYVLLSRQETAEEFGKRLLEDIGVRPDFYYQRREVPRTEDVLSEFQAELWQQAQYLMAVRKSGLWFRNVNQMNCRNCDFKELCLNGVKITPDGLPPTGFVQVENVHPELEDAT